MTDWDDLDRELGAWSGAGSAATFWWRDDDATRVTAPLERLLGLARRHGVPVALAVIPRDSDDALRDRLATEPLAHVLQHGWSHENHATGSDRQEEFGRHRPLPEMLGELTRGWRKISRFERAVPAMVAPWNRIDPMLVSHLPSAGLHAVSTLGARDRRMPAGVHRTNVHVDIVDWQGTRGFVGLGRALDQVLAHLRARRVGEADPTEPTGLMTHHLFHDEDCWGFVDAFLARTRGHREVRWLDAAAAFAP